MGPRKTWLKVAPLAASLRHRDVRLLWAAQLLSELGDWAARLALALLIYERTGNEALTAAVMAIGMLPWLGLGQALATLSDRYPRRTVMVVTDLLRGAIYIAMIVVEQGWLLLVLAFIAAAATPPFEAARSAVLPELVPEDGYGDALALSNITFQAGLVIGYVAGGGLVALTGPANALVVNGGTFLLSAALLARVRGGRIGASTSSVRASLSAALKVLRSDGYLRRAGALTTICASSAMVGEALVPVYAKAHLGASDGVVGLLAAAIPVGSIVAAAVVPRRGSHANLLRASAMTALVGCSLAAGLFMMRPGLMLSLVAYAALGATFGLVIPAHTVLGARLPEQVRGTAFSMLQGLLLGGQGLASIGGGLLARVAGAQAVTALALLPGIGFALYAILTQPREG